MVLTLNGHKQTFIPIQIFREKWELPANFTLTTFEPKDWQVGSMDGVGLSLVKMKQAVIDAVPSEVVWSDLLDLAADLAAVFHSELAAANQNIGLHDVEIDFAVAGFRDVMDAVAYALLRLKQIYRNDTKQIQDQFDFLTVYQTWLDDSVRISTAPHTYQHGGVSFTLRTVYNAYGRVGFEAQTPTGVDYIVDLTLACPAASYMRDLCREVTTAILQALFTSP